MENRRDAFCINTYSYTMTHTAADSIERLADFGFRAAELMMYPGHLWPADMSDGDVAELAGRSKAH